MDDIKKSFNAILYERTTSPFYGTLIVSWFVWNWKIVYLTIFISEDQLNTDKISYITENFCDGLNLILYPLISTVLLLTIVPFISNGAYWLSLRFIKWRREQKNKVELKQLLTLEQSIELREQIFNQEKRIEKILTDKNLEIEQLKSLLEAQKDGNSIKSEQAGAEVSVSDLKMLSTTIKNSKNELDYYSYLVRHIFDGFSLSSVNIPIGFYAKLEAYGIINKGGTYLYNKGKNWNRFYRYMSED